MGGVGDRPNRPGVLIRLWMASTNCRASRRRLAPPHHLAAPLFEHGVPLDDCFELLSALSFLAD